MGEIFDLLLEGIRILFLIGLPLVAGALIAGVISSLVQSFFTVQDAVVNYALKLVSVGLVISLLSASVIELLEQLLLRALHS